MPSIGSPDGDARRTAAVAAASSRHPGSWVKTGRSSSTRPAGRALAEELERAPGLHLSDAGQAQDDRPPDEQLWRALQAFFRFVDEHRDSWSMLYRQARGEGGSLATELDTIRDRIVDLVSYLLGRSRAAHDAPGTDTDLRALAYALVGAAESLAAWLTDHPEEGADATAARLMNLAWVGFRDLLRGAVWRPS